MVSTNNLLPLLAIAVSPRRYIDTEEEETTMIAMQIADLAASKAGLTAAHYAYTHCEVPGAHSSHATLAGSASIAAGG